MKDMGVFGLQEGRVAKAAFDEVTKREFCERLLAWYEANGRKFKWRQTDNPFLVLVSEILLQRTRACQVDESYSDIILKYSSPQRLAEASEKEIRDSIARLGLSRRSSILKRMAQEILKQYGGSVPSTRNELLRLPGVGPYIANAVLCFAFGQDVPVVDANVITLFRRVLGIQSSKKRAHTDRQIWELASSMMPSGKGTDFNRALIDFVGLVCKPVRPSCLACPLGGICLQHGEKG